MDRRQSSRGPSDPEELITRQPSLEKNWQEIKLTGPFRPGGVNHSTTFAGKELEKNWQETKLTGPFRPGGVNHSKTFAGKELAGDKAHGALQTRRS
jgi:hypothetical protein